MESLEREYDDLINEVRQLEGELADYNLAMDKSRAGTDPSELKVHQMNLKARNAVRLRCLRQITFPTVVFPPSPAGSPQRCTYQPFNLPFRRKKLEQ